MNKKLSDLREIVEVDAELNKIQDVDILLERILLEARTMVNADAGSIYVKSGNELVITYAQNDTKQQVLPPGQKLIYSIFKVPIDGRTISGYAALTGKSSNIADVYHLSDEAPYDFDPSYDKISEYRTVSVLTVPLKTNTEEILGVLQVINKRGDSADSPPQPFTEDDELIVSHFASSATVALQRAQMTRALLLRMISMAELRDPKETGPHVNRVAGYALEIYERWAVKVGLPPRQIEKNRDVLRMAAMLHDVGKVAISDIILKKPGKFTPEEQEVMRTHTIRGAQLFISKQSEFDEMASLVALSHHEHWDGSGYPGWVDVETGKPTKLADDGTVLGRKGSEIPIYGRIVSIADVFDALTSHRVYKDSWKEEDVLNEIRKNSGTKFDPELVDVFFEILPQIRQIASRYPDPDN